MARSTAESLEFMLGPFTGTEQMHASRWAPAGVATSRSDATSEVGGTVVVQRYQQYRDGAGSFAVHGV